MTIIEKIKIARICRSILFDKGKSKKVVMAELNNKKLYDDALAERDRLRSIIQKELRGNRL